MLFSSWSDIGRVLALALLGYIALIVLLRVSGKRTLSKMNMFDLVVTIALGSILASLILSKTTALMEGVAAFAALIFGQYAIAWLSVRSPRFQSLIKADPVLLYHDGRFLENAMRKERVSREEVLSAIREAGIGDLQTLGGVVLETNGSVTVLKSSQGEAYATVEGADPAEAGGVRSDV